MDIDFVISHIESLQNYYRDVPIKSEIGPRLEDVKKNQRLTQVYDYFSKNRDKELSTRGIAADLHVPVQVVSAACKRLKDKGFIDLVRQMREGPVLYNTYKFKQKKGKYD